MKSWVTLTQNAIILYCPLHIIEKLRHRENCPLKDFPIPNANLDPGGNLFGDNLPRGNFIGGKFSCHQKLTFPWSIWISYLTDHQIQIRKKTKYEWFLHLWYPRFYVVCFRDTCFDFLYLCFLKCRKI